LKERKKRQREGGRGTFEDQDSSKICGEREREWGREAGRSPRGQMWEARGISTRIAFCDQERGVFNFFLANIWRDNFCFRFLVFKKYF
jgi:hypothetical protein